MRRGRLDLARRVRARYDVRVMIAEPSKRRAPEIEDDDELDLPSRDGAADEGPNGIDHGADAELLGETGDEEIGLDVSEGLDEPVDGALEVNEKEESTRWTVGSEEARDVEDDPDLLAGDEYGWTDANEPADEIDLESDLDAEPEGRAGSGDRGEEGPDEPAEAALDTMPGEPLPPLDADADNPPEDEPFALEVLREVTGGLPDEPEHAPER